DFDSLCSQEWVSSVDDAESARGVGELGRPTAKLDCEARAGDERIERDESFEGFAKRLTVRPELVGEIGEDAVDFFDFLDLELADAIARLDGRRRLDEERSACR